MRQNFVHRDATFQDLAGLLGTCDMKREVIALNPNAAQWKPGAVWNKIFMASAMSKTMREMWREQESDIKGKVTNTVTAKDDGFRRAIQAAAKTRPTTFLSTDFVRTLGTPAELTAPPQSTMHAQRTIFDRSMCENQAFAILQKIQAGRVPYIKTEGKEMLVAMVLDRPLVEAQNLVRNRDAFIEELVKTLSDKKEHPVIVQMLKADAGWRRLRPLREITCPFDSRRISRFRVITAGSTCLTAGLSLVS